jgi:hypothetical protein
MYYYKYTGLTNGEHKNSVSIYGSGLWTRIVKCFFAISHDIVYVRSENIIFLCTSVFDLGRDFIGFEFATNRNERTLRSLTFCGRFELVAHLFNKKWEGPNPDKL